MNIQEFGSLLFEIEVNAHIAHLQTTSFAEHSALDSLYKEMPELRDHFLEDFQGNSSIIRGYKPINIQEGVDMITYLKSKSALIEQFRLTLTDGFLQQDIDDIRSLISSTLYKLKNLS